MEPGTAGSFGGYLLFWIAYFTIVYSALTFVYVKRRGRLPDAPGRGGETRPDAAWEERDRALRRRLIRIGAGLMAAPLLLPFLLRWLM